MSDKLGRLRYVDNQEEVFLGHSVTRSQTISVETAQMIDNETRSLIEEAEKKATKILTDNIDVLHRVSSALLEYETLSGDEVQLLVDGGTIDRSDDSDTGASGHRSSVPASGKARKPDAPGGMEPEPQPGA